VDLALSRMWQPTLTPPFVFSSFNFAAKFCHNMSALSRLSSSTFRAKIDPEISVFGIAMSKRFGTSSLIGFELK